MLQSDPQGENFPEVISAMRHRLRTIVLVIVTLFFPLTSWSRGIAPKSLAKGLGLSLASPGGYNETRAQYAGFFRAAVISWRVDRRSAGQPGPGRRRGKLWPDDSCALRDRCCSLRDFTHGCILERKAGAPVRSGS